MPLAVVSSIAVAYLFFLAVAKPAACKTHRPLTLLDRDLVNRPDRPVVEMTNLDFAVDHVEP